MTNEEIMQLWEAHRPFVYKIALRYTGQAEIDDLLQEGYLGFYAAATRFDENAGASFLTYAGFWVRQRMRRYIENCCSVVRISSGMAEKVRKYKKLQSDYQKQFGRKPSANEIRALMGIGQTEYDTMQQAVRMGTVASLSAPIGEDDATVEELIGNDGIEDAIIDRINQEDMKRDVHAAVDKLPDREREVITLRYFKGLTMEQVGQLEDRSIESVRQCQAKAMRHLRGPSYSEPLRCYMGLSDRQLSAAMHSTVSGFNRTWTSATEKAAFIGLGERY